ncbi:hypothetical protein [Marispirochaeta sp.]|uniref:hypothetical protein n=1 Tax=Marispirochaeta sp. TaxID=2038653 RepID=UPI0029C6CDB8|nr:hypothetical protein [Marispirochaeta sp.]
MIILVTGGIDAGKTSYLRQQAAQNGAAAWLSVKSFSGYDLLMLPAEQRIPLARPADADVPGDWFHFRRFRFNPAAFVTAESFWRNYRGSTPKELILDEAGPLEMEGRGFAPLLRLLLATGADLSVSVRPSLLTALPQAFGFVPDRIIRL